MKQTKLVGILLVACLLSLLPMQVVASVYWFEDFEDGNYDGWVVVEGTFDASSKYLEATQAGWNTIYNMSEVVCGQWIWDLREDPIQEVDMHVFFIAIGDNVSSISGYSVSAEYGTTSNLTLYRWDDGVSTVLDRDTIPTDNVTWVNYNVSVDSTGYIQVVRISEVVLWDTDTTHTSSENFIFHCEEDGAIDEITIVSCDYTPPVTTTGTGREPQPLPWWWPVPFFVLATIVITWWWWRRRD